MKRFVVIVALFVGAYFVFTASIESKTESMIERAEAFAEQGRYADALDQLDAVEDWYGWTEAAGRVSDVRAAVEKKKRVHDAKQRLAQDVEDDEDLDDMEREQRAAEERQADAERRVQEARKKASLLTGKN